MLKTPDSLGDLIAAHYPDVTEKVLNENHIASHCSICDREMGLQILGTHTALKHSSYGPVDDFKYPYHVSLRCPVCHGFAVWVLFRHNRLELPDNKVVTRIFRISAIPPDGKYDIPGLPEEPKGLKQAYFEAIHSLNNNCPMAAAAMFRRALQIITRDILGASHGTLASELSSLVGKPNKLGVTLSTSFNNHSYIIREVGNQAAHPDRDPDLLSFTHEDAQDLYEMFLEIVSELFVAPAAAKAARQSLMARRKVTIP